MMKIKTMLIPCAAGLSIMALASCKNKSYMPQFAPLGSEISESEFEPQKDLFKNYLADLDKDFEIEGNLYITTKNDKKELNEKTESSQSVLVKYDTNTGVLKSLKKTSAKIKSDVSSGKETEVIDSQYQPYRDLYCLLDLESKSGSLSSLNSLDVERNICDLSEELVLIDSKGKFYKNDDIYTFTIDVSDPNGSFIKGKWQFSINENRVTYRFEYSDSMIMIRNPGTDYEYSYTQSKKRNGSFTLKYKSVSLSPKDVTKYGMIA